MKKLCVCKQRYQGCENDIAIAQKRATIWANGDREAIDSVDFHDKITKCYDIIFNTDIAKQAIQNNKALWLDNAKQAITEHQVSFAILPIGEVLYEEGLFHQLKTSLLNFSSDDE